MEESKRSKENQWTTWRPKLPCWTRDREECRYYACEQLWDDVPRWWWKISYSQRKIFAANAWSETKTTSSAERSSTLSRSRGERERERERENSRTGSSRSKWWKKEVENQRQMAVMSSRDESSLSLSLSLSLSSRCPLVESINWDQWWPLVSLYGSLVHVDVRVNFTIGSCSFIIISY